MEGPGALGGVEAPGGTAGADDADEGDCGVPVLERGVIWLSGSILEGGIAEELTEWDVFKIYAERDLLEKSVLARDRF